MFPVFYSTLAPEAIATLAFSQYAIDLPKTCQFWHRGLSDVYLLETLSNLYVLRVSHYHWRSKNEVAFELELLNFLYKQNIPVAHPLMSKEG